MAHHATLGATFTFDSVSLPELIEFSVDGVEVGSREVSIITSTWRVFEPTVPNGGSLKAKVFYDHAAYTTILGLLGTPANAAWAIAFDTTQTISGNGHLTGVTISDFKQDGRATMDLTIKNTGAVTFANT